MARFVNLNRILDNNRDQSEEMGRRVVGEMRPELNTANQAIGTVASNPLGAYGTEGAQDAVAQAQAKLTMSGSNGGRQAMLGVGANALDAWMSGQSQALGQTRSRFAGLTDKLKEAETEAGNRSQFQSQLQADNARRAKEAEDARWQKGEDERMKKAYEDQKMARFRDNRPQSHEQQEYAYWSRGGVKLPKPLNSY